MGNSGEHSAYTVLNMLFATAVFREKGHEKRARFLSSPFDFL
jgi:hypothetical protein